MDLTMKLMATTDALKEAGIPISVEDFERRLGFKLDPQLLKLVQTLDRIQYDEENKTLAYVSLHNIKSGRDVLRVLETQRVFQGLSVKQLRDGWKQCLEEITELEKDNLIIVYRTKKDQTPRHIWLNPDALPLRAHEDSSLTNLWNTVPVPSHSTLVQTLLQNGLKPTNVQPESLKLNVQPVKQQRRKKARRAKITNLHMKGVLKDYSRI